MATSDRVPDTVKTGPLNHQVVERNNSSTWVVAAFDRPEDAEMFADMNPSRTVRLRPEHIELQRYVKELRRTAVEPTAGG